MVSVTVGCTLAHVSAQGHDKMRSGADLRGASPLVSFNHVIDPHSVAFSSSLYTTICNPKPNPNPDPKLNYNPDPDPNPSLTLIPTLTLTLQWSLIRR